MMSWISIALKFGISAIAILFFESDRIWKREEPEYKPGLRIVSHKVATP